MERLAREAFTDVGNILQKRRMTDHIDNFGCHLTENVKWVEKSPQIRTDLCFLVLFIERYECRGTGLKCFQLQSLWLSSSFKGEMPMILSYKYECRQAKKFLRQVHSSFILVLETLSFLFLLCLKDETGVI